METKASSSDVGDKAAMELVHFLQVTAKQTLKLCSSEPSLDRDTARRAKRCAIHTKYFPGLCSPDCFDTMAAVSAILDTHTPLCPTDCDLQHHLLTCAVFSPAVMFRVDTGDVPLTFKLCIQACFNAGWERHMNVPDPLETLRYPLLHLACLHGSYIAVKKLVQEMQFKPVVSVSSKETPLHVAARYFPVTYTDRILMADTFKAILTFLIWQDKEILFKADAKGDTVLHVIARCINTTTNVEERLSDTQPKKNCLTKQKQSYHRALKIFLHALSDLQLSDKLCKKKVCKLVHDRNDRDRKFVDILQEGPEKFTAQALTGYAKEVLPFCFDDERVDLACSVCPSSCPCNGSAAVAEKQSYQTLVRQNEVGGNAVQEPVSSSLSPPANVDHSTTSVPEPQATPDQPAQVQVVQASVSQVVHASAPQVVQASAPQVVHASTPPIRPQAQVHSIQVLGQAATGNPSPQTNVAAQPVQHIPVVFIKQEPIDLGYDAHTCCYTTNHIDTSMLQRPQRQNAFIIRTGPAAVATPAQNPLPVQLVEGNVVRLGGSPPLQLPPLQLSPSQSQSLVQGSQPVTNAAASSDQLSTACTQTTANLPQQRGQIPPPNFSQTPQGQTGATAHPSGRRVLPQSKEVHSKRKGKESRSIKELALEALKNIPSTGYKIDLLHTPLCDKGCSIVHHDLVLTLLSTSNRLICRGSVNGFTQLLENTKANFFKCLKKNFDEGFAKDRDVPDGLDILHYPLVHLAGMFYKYSSVDMLVHLGFDRSPRSPRTGELPLHATVRYGYKTGMKMYKSFNKNNFESLFSKVFQSLSRGMNLIKLLSQQDHNGDTCLHVAAKRMIERPAPVTRPSDIMASETPDSTQECETSSSRKQPSDDLSAVCKLKETAPQHRFRADFYTHCLGYIFKKLQEVATMALTRKVDVTLLEPVFSVKNNKGETFLQILCKEHHIAAVSITAVLSRFPHAAFSDCVKQCVPKSCWPAHVYVQESTTSVANPREPVSSPVELPKPLEMQTDARPSKPESPKSSSDVNLTQVSPTAASVKAVAHESNSTPSPATPLQQGTAAVSPSPVSYTSDLLDSMLTPVVANPGHATLRPTTKRKIIEALREDYTERLELAVKGRREVEEDILKHRSTTGELTEVMAKKREEMQTLERELQELQKVMWHKNQAIQALENSLEQFTKEEEELEKNLIVLQDADPEPLAKKSKTQESGCSDTKM